MSVLFGDRKRVTVVGVIGLAVAVIGLLIFSVPLRVHAAAPGGFYQQRNLVSDLPGAVIQDSNLVNPWGIAFSATSPFWVADNVTGTSTLYSGDVNGPLVKVPMVVTIPGGGAPTGVVFNGTADFVVHSGTSSGPARFIFASQTGVISGWNSAVPPPSPSTNAQIGATADAVFTGLAIGQVG